MKKFFLTVLLSLCSISCSDTNPSVSPDPTIVDAHNFLKAAYENIQARRDVAIKNNDRRITYSGRECESTIILSITKDDKVIVTIKQSIDWRLVSEVLGVGDGVWVKGPIVSDFVSLIHPESNSTTTENELLVEWRSLEEAERAAKAMEFLRTSCDKSRKFGF